MIPKIPQEDKDLPELLSEVKMLLLEPATLLTAKGAEGNGFPLSARDAGAVERWLAAGRLMALLVGQGAEPEGLAQWCRANGVGLAPYDGQKELAVAAIAFENQAQPNECCYLGADLEDLPAMSVCGLAGAAADAPEFVLAMAHVVSEKPSGPGVLADLVERILNPVR